MSDERYDTAENSPVARTREALPVIAKGARLVEVTRSSHAPRAYRFADEAWIGRDPQALVRLDDAKVSRQHARIYRDGDGWMIEDRGSRNGTLVNGVRLQGAAPLRFSDSVQVAASRLFLFTGDDEVQERLVELQKNEAIAQLASGVAHDFNNLLSVITANVDCLAVTVPEGAGAAETRQCLEEMKTAATRASELTRKLLDIARPKQRKEAMVDVGKLVEEVATLCRRTFPSHIVMHTKTAAKLDVVGDPTQLHQVLLNLCINAREAMPEGGEISVRAEARHLQQGEIALLPAGPHVVLRVSDTGSGMDEATRRRAFDPFFSTKGRTGGTGLGLATVYSVVSAHAGHVEVRSAVGQGTTFTICLPLGGKVLQAREPAETLGTPGAPRGHFILVVDDDDDVRRATRRLLQKIGHEVLEARGGEAAIAALKRHREAISLVLLDVDMPEMDGVEVFRRLRALDAEVRVVMTSGAADDETMQRLREVGIQGLLPKPYDADALRMLFLISE